MKTYQQKKGEYSKKLFQIIRAEKQGNISQVEKGQMITALTDEANKVDHLSANEILTHYMDMEESYAKEIEDQEAKKTLTKEEERKRQILSGI